MAAYDQLIQTVNNLIGQFGGPATLMLSVAPPYDPTTGTAAAQVDNYAVQVIAFDFLQKKDGDGMQGGTLIESGDKMVYMMAADYVPRPDPKTTTLLWCGRQYSILTVKEMNPSGSVKVCTELFIRE